MCRAHRGTPEQPARRPQGATQKAQHDRRGSLTDEPGVTGSPAATDGCSQEHRLLHPKGQGIYETILDIFPSNIIEAMAQNQMLAVVFFSILFGLALNKTNHLTNNFGEAFEKLNTVFMQLVIMVISFAPIGVFCLIGKFVITDGLDIFQEAFKYVLLLIIVLLIHAIFT